MKLIFVRHGESEANVLRVISNHSLPHALTGRGRGQAHRLAERVQGSDIVRIYCSAILRARQTAEIVAQETCRIIQIGFFLLARIQRSPAAALGRKQQS